MVSKELIEDLTGAAIGGVSRTQIKTRLIEETGYPENEIEKLVSAMCFAGKPRFINYWKFYTLPIDKKAKRIRFPFTQLYIYPNFLSAKECEILRLMTDMAVRPSTVANPQDANISSSYRTSSTADLKWQSHPFINYVDNKLQRALGINPFVGEILQVQKYLPGQYYKEHYDFFSPLAPEYKVYTEWMGQRTWTSMVYLNDVEEGGETYFKHLNLKVKPKEGTAIFWNNLYPFGIPNLKTMHEALPPLSGNKYVATKWWRSWSLVP